MKHPTSLDTLRELRTPVKNVNEQHREALSPLERLATSITKRIGTMGFFFIILIWTVFWLSWNSFAPANLRFDPPMGFVFWLFISNMIQIFLMPLIMIAQNVDAHHSELRSESQFEVNLKTEKEVDAIMEHLEYQNRLLVSIARKVGVDESELNGHLPL